MGIEFGGKIQREPEAIPRDAVVFSGHEVSSEKEDGVKFRRIPRKHVDSGTWYTFTREFPEIQGALPGIAFSEEQAVKIGSKLSKKHGKILILKHSMSGLGFIE
jgi:hypothetical protein